MRKIAAMFILVFAAAPAVAAEKWADGRLTVTAGLEIWLDAAQQNAARKQLGQSELTPDSRIETWFDASGRGRHLVQKNRAAQPQFQVEGDYRAVRFDGEKAHFTLNGLASSIKDVTIFVVAAPFSNAGGFQG